ncbi:hypothetical protein [Myxococcus sp. AM011]|nr:hypothetical protein [Myxococcus sp. AM011]
MSDEVEAVGWDAIDTALGGVHGDIEPPALHASLGGRSWRA